MVNGLFWGWKFGMLAVGTIALSIEPCALSWMLMARDYDRNRAREVLNRQKGKSASTGGKSALSQFIRIYIPHRPGSFYQDRRSLSWSWKQYHGG